MERQKNNGWTRGSIIFLCVYLLGMIGNIGIVLFRDKFIEIFNHMNVDLPVATVFLFQYGHTFSTVIIFLTIILLTIELIKKQFVGIKTSATVFFILFFWDIILLSNYFFPMFLISMGK